MATVKVRRNFQQARWDEPIIYDMSVPGVRGILPPPVERAVVDRVGDVVGELGSMLRRELPNLPEVSQKHVLMHWIHLSQETMGANLTNDISEGTCTMKYNPRVNEDLVGEPDFADLHPHQDDDTVQGILQIYHAFEQMLKEVSGMDRFTLQPSGGNHAVFTAASIARAYHAARGEGDQRDETITTIFSHPCDAAAPATAGYKIITLPPDENGIPDLDALRAAVSNRTAAIFMTNPEDVGIFNPRVDEFVRIVHEAGGLAFYDQANANAFLGVARAKESGFDMCHFNVHKTFSTPHASGGPATGAFGCIEALAKYLPTPTVEFDGTRYFLDHDRPETIGKVKDFYGNANNVLRAYAWTMMLGADGLREVADISVLNNNYLEKKLLTVPGLTSAYQGNGIRRQEQVRYSWQTLKDDTGIGTDEVNRRLIDFGIASYWTSHHPWIIPEPMTLEPCETYSVEDLDEYYEALSQVSEESYRDPDFVKEAPYASSSHRRNDEAALDDPKRWAMTWRAYKRKQEV
ncbi:MAG: glycine dehydrogenase subunit 2 [Chloroflexota bacterium]|jgi:glycine dehydrogenase subunit 2|nr:glycine dehydrogenase subunit 2 [Chloroflexota bacterium]